MTFLRRAVPALVAVLGLAVPLAGCERHGAQPSAPQQGSGQGQGERPAQAQRKGLTDPKAICQAAAEARKKTIPLAKAFAQKAPKGSWKWSDDGVNEAGNALADALTEEAGTLDGLVGNVSDQRLVSGAKDYLKLVKTFSDELETHADPGTVDSDVYSYEVDEPQGGFLLTACRLGGNYKKTA